MKAKLSDAIVLGSTYVKLDPNNWLWRDKTCGCLIGMGLAEVTQGQYLGTLQGSRPMRILEEWPWLQDIRIYPSDSGMEMAAIDIISIMATKVFHGTMKFEDVIQWIRENEPKEEEVNGEGSGSTGTGDVPATVVGSSNQEGVELPTGERCSPETIGVG